TIPQLLTRKPKQFGWCKKRDYRDLSRREYCANPFTSTMWQTRLILLKQAADREVAVQSLDRESTLARQLRSAIQRVDDGSYGVCPQCEEEIGPNRLKAIPWAEFCIRCQEQADRMGATRGSFRMPDGFKQAA